MEVEDRDFKQLRAKVLPTPWFEQYCKDYFQIVVNSEHEVHYGSIYRVILKVILAPCCYTLRHDFRRSKSFGNLYYSPGIVQSPVSQFH
jgi:hypothetical protein